MAEKAYLETETGGRINCLFNPGELQITMSSNWRGDTIPGQSGPTMKFEGGQSGIDVAGAVLRHDEHRRHRHVAHQPADEAGPDRLDVARLQRGDEQRPPALGQVPLGQLPLVPLRRHQPVDHVRLLRRRRHPAARQGQRRPDAVRARRHVAGAEPDVGHAQAGGGPPDPAGGEPGAHRRALLRRRHQVAADRRGNGIADPFRLRPGAIIDIPRLDEDR